MKDCGSILQPQLTLEEDKTVVKYAVIAIHFDDIDNAAVRTAQILVKYDSGSFFIGSTEEVNDHWRISV